MSRKLLSVALLMLAPAVFAQTEGDPVAGQDKSVTCLGCHGIDGYRNAYPAYRVPKIGGQHADYLLTSLQAYASGERRHPTMNAQAGSLSEQDMADIAAYFEQAVEGGQ